jgi:hypothetical protein
MSVKVFPIGNFGDGGGNIEEGEQAVASDGCNDSLSLSSRHSGHLAVPSGRPAQEQFVLISIFMGGLCFVE